MTNPVLRFEAQLRPNSFNPDTRQFIAVVATSAPIARNGLDEVLDLDAIGTAGWPSRIPLQADHSMSVRDTIGELSNLRMEDLPNGVRALVADAKVADGSHTAAIRANLAAGMQRGVSIQMSVLKATETKDAATGRRVRTVTAGRLVEASLVVHPADVLSTVRSESLEPQTAPAPASPPAPSPPATVPTVTRMTAEQFTSVCRSAGVPDETITALAASDASDTERLAIARAAIPAQPVIRTTPTDHNATSLDNPTVLRQAAIDGFDAVIRGAAATGNAAALLAEGDAGISRRFLRAAGESIIGLSDETVKRNAAATSDYAIVAGALANIATRREFEAVRSPLADLFGRDTVTTFNPEVRALIDWTTLAMAPKLENGEYKSSYIDESGEEVSVTVRGGITAISWELSINAVGRLGNMAQKQGKRYAADQADQQVAFLEQANGAGKTMKDGKPVFHASRGNIEVFQQSQATMVDALFGVRSKMARRKGAGNVMIGEYPTHWIVHPDYEATAVRLLAAISASALADVNPLAGKLQIVVEPRLSNPSRSWLVVDPAKMDGAVRVFLRGHEAPFTASRQNWDTDALEFKIRHAFGLGWLEWRSWTRLDHTTN